MKRRIAIILLLLAGGAIVNVAVAWGCAVRTSAKPVSVQWLDDVDVPIALPRSWRYAMSTWKGTGCREKRYHSMLARMDIPGCGNVPEVEIPGGLSYIVNEFGGRVHAPHAEHSIAYADAYCATVESVQFGLPFQSLGFEIVRPELKWWALTEPRYPDPPSRSGLVVRDNGLEKRPTILPLRPIFPGFIINTLFYALILWLLFFAPFAARRMLRRRRGQCEKCAYPIGTWGGSPVCTECGAAVHLPPAASKRLQS